MEAHSPRLWLEIWRQWVPIAVAVTLLCGIVYVVAQQSIRLEANQPQVQMAEDAAAALAGGEDPASLTGTRPIDIARSLAAYLVVYDEKGQPLAWSGELDQAAPAVPQGVLTSARDRGQNRVTWQPRPGVRSAIVVVPYQGARSGFVLAGRSLREAEALSSTLLLLVGFGWLGSLVAVFIATWVSRAVAAKLL
ncbi:MAG: hypothetical protein NTV14_03030 [Coprothermobacterota bacterium]|nr:hypothetical protein [Coprothermobacterota bacterium]